MLAELIERIRNFDYKKNWKCVAITVAASLFILILLVVVLVIILSGFEDYQEAALKRHNELRAKHGSGPLKLDRKLTNIAVRDADHQEKQGMINHNFPETIPKGLGENLYMSFTKDDKQKVEEAVAATNMFYSEEKLYNYSNPRYTYETGHFTTMVWKGAKKLGIGVAITSKGTFVAAVYEPHMWGEFAENVGRPK